MYTFDGRIRYSELDEYGNLSLAGIMNYLQDCSTFQSEDVGLGIGHLTDHHRAWWLSSWNIVIDRYPSLGEEVSIATWPYAFHGFYGYRNFTICDKKGDYLVRADSVWFHFDTERGRPTKVEEEDIRGYMIDGEKRLDMEEAPRKITVPQDYTQGMAMSVTRHQIDTNHHVNNARYVELAGEAVPAGFLAERVRVEYKRAAVLSDVICPRVSRLKDGYTVALCDKEGETYAAVCLHGRMREGVR